MGKRKMWELLGDKGCAFAQGSRTAMGPYPLSKQNASGLSARKCTKLLIMMLQGRVEGSCLSHSMTMCSRVWTSALPQGQLVGRWGKNLCLYSPMGAWPVVMRVKRAHRELVKPMTGSHEPVRGPLTRHSGATQKPIQYYYVILGLTPIIPRALHCHPAHFPCSDPGYQCRDAKTL